MQIVGRGWFQNASAFKAFYEELLPQGVTQFDIDLKACTYLDSTFLGQMTGLGMRLRRISGPTPGHLHIFNAGERNMELMCNLGIDKLMSIDVSGVNYTDTTSLKKLNISPADKQQTGSDMLEAHENLVEADPANAPKFKDVIAYLKEDLGASGID